MIRYSISRAQLHGQIDATNPSWFNDAATVLAGLPATPASSDFKPLWSKIKQIYIDLQHSKCCFCEKPLEGKIEQDVEHFRPKAQVSTWKVPARLVAQGVAVQQPADGAAESGYRQLAYEPFNYAMACKTCNSSLKRNLFPIEGHRDSTGTDPAQMTAENPLFIYPISDVDVDPEELIEFIGLSPVPKAVNGYEFRRALVTIEVFRLDDSKGRRSLFKLRAYLLRLLFDELELREAATTADKRQKHQKAIDALTSPEAPFASCMRSFERLYAANVLRAEQIADECQNYMRTKSISR